MNIMVPDHKAPVVECTHVSRALSALAVFNTYYYWGKFLEQKEFPAISIINRDLFRDVREWITDARVDSVPHRR